jgi:integrase
MKAGKEHRKPLTPRALAILDEMEKIRRGPFIFPADPGEGPLSEMALEMLLRRLGAKTATVHGFRATFKTWAGDATQFPRELVEEALAHEIGNPVERAYKRSDALERRRELMLAWERHVSENAE